MTAFHPLADIVSAAVERSGCEPVRAQVGVDWATVDLPRQPRNRGV